MMGKKSPKAWVVGANMGYGHLRAAFALEHLAQGGVITANWYRGIPRLDKLIWEETRVLYEFVSRLKELPVLGNAVFGLFDKLQTIKDFYPRTERIEPPTLQVKQLYGLIEQRNWGRHLIEMLSRKPLPLVATFPAIAFMAEYWQYEQPIFLVVTDAHVSRAWAPLDASQTRIRYCVPSREAAERIKGYGVPQENIVYTGFPLPPRLVEHARQDLAKRWEVLDPEMRYTRMYSDLVRHYIGYVPVQKRRPVRVAFAIGGAGAQEDIGKNIVKSLSPLLKAKSMRLSVNAGIHKRIAADFAKLRKEEKLSSGIHAPLRVLRANTISSYFEGFSKMLRQTDILWSKPSELIFYTALGTPLIMSPPVGSQEKENREWLLSVGAGIDETNPALAHQWLPDLLHSGNLAEAALEGFIEIEKNGASTIAHLIANQ